MIIGLTGRAQSGKTTAAFALKEKGFAYLRFADPLKDMLRVIGLTDEQLDGNEKEIPIALLCGKSPRYAMQTLGTEWGRLLIDQDFWVTAWMRKASILAKQGKDIVADDVRFMNEAQAIRQLGGEIWRVVRHANIGTHASETEQQLIMDDRVVANVDISLDDYRKWIKELV